MSTPQIIKKKSSTTKKLWNQKEDSILKDIVDQGQFQQWKSISQILQKKYGIKGKTPEDCQNRWLNNTELSLKTDSWTQQEERKMIEYHQQFGNKWAKIAQMLSGKTDNCVKNYFYCKLRKGFKKVNRYISLSKNKGQSKEIKMNVLIKCVAVAEDRFQKKLGVTQQLIDKCEQIKSKLFELAKDSFKQQSNQEKMDQILDDLLIFNKSYKKKKRTKFNSRGKPRKIKKKITCKQANKQAIKQKETEQSSSPSPSPQIFPNNQQQNIDQEENPYRILDITKAESVCRDLLKSRLASGESMDFLGKLSRLGSMDVISRLGQMQWPSSSHLSPFQNLSAVQTRQKISFQKTNLMTYSRQDTVDRNKVDFILIPPNLSVPSFESSNLFTQMLATSSAELCRQYGGMGQGELFSVQNLLTRSREGFRQQNANPLMQELKKISSLDYENFHLCYKK